MLAPDDASERQLRLLRAANVDLTDEVRSRTAATALNAADPGADYSKPLASNTTAQQQVAAELVARGQKEKMSAGETAVLEAAAEVVVAQYPQQSYLPDLTKLLWNDMSGGSHARAWHREAFHDTYTAGYRALQLLIPAHAFLDTAWRLWHRRRGGTGDPYSEGDARNRDRP
ncbi:hypothetical protein [Allobranchiibius sp. CTAmp26]|uniref:hypothetical protein n=1 Tax=Allobranchiibius sp. CTAmp26 TaxID=2815214 RepID=UPI001AA125FE|nr:hypothetical protein [Allobranchiibius sp. CTAmp26]MBO1755051.1 hypothetical protein [Allobranchiibius sp. CTAmp26]